MSRGQLVYQSYDYGYMAPDTQGVTNFHTLVQPFIGHTGGGYYLTIQGHDLYRSHMNQPFQGAGNHMAPPRLPFLATLNFPDLSNLPNDLVSHDSMWLVAPSKLPSDVLKF